MDDFERTLSKEKLLDAADTLADLQVAFSKVQMADDDQAKEAVLASLACVMAGLHVAELAAHLGEGMEFYDAIRATARGEMKINPKMAKDWNEGINKMRDPMRHN